MRVFVTNTPLLVRLGTGEEIGTGTGAGGNTGISASAARRVANTNARLEAADLKKANSQTVQEFLGKFVEEGRRENVTDAQMRRMVKGMPVLRTGLERILDDTTSGGRFGGAAGGGAGISQRELNRIRAGVGLGPARLVDPTNNQADIDRGLVNANLRKLERQIPKRSFGPSLTDLFTNVGGFLDRSVIAIDALRRESGQLATLQAGGQKLGIQRADLLETQAARQTQLSGLEGQRAALISGGATGRSKEVKALDTQISAVTKITTRLGQALDDNAASIKENEAAVEGQTKVFKAAKDAVPGLPTRLAGFGVAGIAAGASFAVTNLVIGAAQAAMEALGNTVGPAIDRAMGSPAATAQITEGLAQAGKSAGGNYQAALFQQLAQVGEAPSNLNRYGALAQRAQGIAGNAAAEQRLGLERANANVVRGNQEFPAGFDRSLFRSTGGFFDTGFGIPGLLGLQLSQGELLQQELSGGGMGASGQTGSPLDALFSVLDARQLDQNWVDQQKIKATDEFVDRLGAINKRLEDSGSKLSLTVTNVDADVKKTADAFRSLGQTGLADEIERKKLTIAGGPVTALSGAQILKSLQEQAAGITPQALIETDERSRRAQEGLRIQRINLAQQETIPGQFGISRALNPLPSVASLPGLVPGRDTSGIASIFNDVNKSVASSVQGAMRFVATNLPGYGTQFAQALGKATVYAQQISDLNVGVQVEQAAYAAHQFGFSIFQASRALKDVKELSTGIRQADSDGLGILERRSYLLGRESQQLSLNLSQRQINFQTALAGFQAPGLSGQERAARLAEAKLEADYAQKQLNIQKEQFGIAGQIFDIQNQRQIGDLVKQIGLLGEGRKVALDTAEAQLKIQGLSAQLDIEGQKATQLFNEATARVADEQAYQANLVAQTGTQLTSLTKSVVDAFDTTYKQMLSEINGTKFTVNSDGSVSATSGTSSLSGKAADDYVYPYPYGTKIPIAGTLGTTMTTEKSVYEMTTGKDLNFNGIAGYATGIVGDAKGRTSITVGEAAGEKVAILKDPYSMILPGLGGGGGQTVIQVTVTGNNISADTDLEELANTIAEKVETKMSQKAKLVASPFFRQ
jgi:hypothetical protein